MHHGREAPATARAAAHQREWPALQHRQVEWDLASRGRPGDDEPATGLEARAALVPYGRADTVEHHVDAATAGELLDPLTELRRGRVVDDLVGAELLGLRELPVAPGRGDRARADPLGHQQPEAADTAADRLDQDVFALLELDALEEAVPGGVTRERKRRRFLEPHALGDSLEIGRGHLAVLRVAAVELAAESLLPVAELVAPEHARRAGAALDSILDDDAVAFFPARHAGPETGDFSRDVEPEDARQATGRRAPGAQREVGVIHRRRAHAYDDLAGARFRIGAVAEDQLLGTSGLGDVDRFHRKIA